MQASPVVGPERYWNGQTESQLHFTVTKLEPIVILLLQNWPGDDESCRPELLLPRPTGRGRLLFATVQHKGALN